MWRSLAGCMGYSSWSIGHLYLLLLIPRPKLSAPALLQSGSYCPMYIILPSLSAAQRYWVCKKLKTELWNFYTGRREHLAYNLCHCLWFTRNTWRYVSIWFDLIASCTPLNDNTAKYQTVSFQTTDHRPPVSQSVVQWAFPMSGRLDTIFVLQLTETTVP